MRTLMRYEAVLWGLLLSLTFAMPARAVVVEVDEDVMTSSFFTGTDLVRGYGEDNRNVLRVSTNEPFGLVGAETIYLTFDYDFSAFTGPVQALLTVQSVSGGFGADAGAGNPFTVSAHGVDANPLTSITDNTNPGGAIDWLSFYEDHILPADAAAFTTINGLGTFTFDVSSVVNSWVSGTQPFHALALTGKNDTSGADFLHGFLNNSENPGSTYLTITAVPEPSEWAMLAAGLALIGCRAARRSRATPV